VKAPTSDLIINALPLPVLTVGAGGEILHANAAAESFFDNSLRVLQRLFQLRPERRWAEAA